MLIRLDRGNGRGLRVQVEAQLREAIRAGRLEPGVRVPPSRTLAVQLGVARGVVTAAYAQLATEGYLDARQGSGTRVGRLPGAPPASPRPARARAPRPRYAFAGGLPDPNLFPRTAWARAQREAMAELSHAHLGHPDARGTRELRAAMAEHVGRVRGVLARASSVMITGGFRQGFALVCRGLVRQGVRRLAVEDPGLAAHRRIAERAGLEVAAVPVDADGLDVAALERTGAEAVLVTPAHEFPTGAVLAPERRAALIEWAQARRALIVEDDYDAEYRYDREPVGALQGLAPERVVYGGTVSKVLTPALRLGWLVLPGTLRAPLVEEKLLSDYASPVLAQLALARFVARGDLDRHLRRSRLVYRRKRAALLDALGRELPGARPEGVSAGLHVLLRLPGPRPAAEVVRRARERGVAVEDATACWRDPRDAGQALLLGYGALPEAAIPRAVAELARAVR